MKKQYKRLVCALLASVLTSAVGAQAARAQTTEPAKESILTLEGAIELAGAGSPDIDAAEASVRAASAARTVAGPDLHVPKLAGQSLPYLYWEIRAFKEGTRKSDIMAPNVTALAYEDIADVATYFSQQTRKPDGQKDESRIAAGQSLFYSRMPSCAMCHTSSSGRGMPMRGMMGGGMMSGGMGGMMGSGTANAPNLEGQHASYIVDQLNRFASGERQGTVMNRMAASLDDADRQAVAEFLSSTP